MFLHGKATPSSVSVLVAAAVSSAWMPCRQLNRRSAGDVRNLLPGAAPGKRLRSVASPRHGQATGQEPFLMGVSAEYAAEPRIRCGGGVPDPNRLSMRIAPRTLLCMSVF